MTFAGAGLDINEVPKAFFPLVLPRALRFRGSSSHFQDRLQASPTAQASKGVPEAQTFAGVRVKISIIAITTSMKFVSGSQSQRQKRVYTKYHGELKAVYVRIYKKI